MPYHIVNGAPRPSTPVEIKIWTNPGEVEPEALQQLQNVSTLPWVYKHIAVMPDVHFGKGCTIGSVIAMKDAICPAAVGVDIGCGMLACCTNITANQLPDNLEAIRHSFERSVPVGFNFHEECPLEGSDDFFLSEFDLIMSGFTFLHPKVQKKLSNAERQIGTLGGGNHFIEMCLDEEDRAWIVIHSGSRNIGKELAEIHISIAQGLAHNRDIADKDLAALLAGTPEMQAYRNDLSWAQSYAYMNRVVMWQLIGRDLQFYFPNFSTEAVISCHHNYVAEEVHFGEQVLVTRKGAISAEKGKLGIIPGSMGAKSYIVRGLGNPDSFNSASHGAGRRMSRGKARKVFTTDDLIKQTDGVCCRKDSGVLDEIPGAYKDIDIVMENQKDLVEVVHTLKQVMCIKG